MQKQHILMAAVFGLILSTVLATAAPYTPDNETVLLYHFDEAAGTGMPQDSSFYGNSPTTGGPTATGDTGQFGLAMKYANSAKSSIPNDPSFANVQTQGLIEFWMNPDPTTLDRWGNDQAVVTKDGGGINAGEFQLGFRMNPTATYGGGQFYLLMDGAPGQQRMLRTPGLITASQWYHVELAWDSVSTPTITVDGIVQPFTDSAPYADTSYVGPLFTTGVPLNVGHTQGNAPAGSFILLDELRILDTRVLPEPTTALMMCVCGLVLPALRRRRR